MMTMSIIRFFWFLFPFIKEIFLGKELNKNDKEKVSSISKEASGNSGLRKFLIFVGCASICINIFVIDKVIIITKENIEIKKNLKDKKEICIENKKEDIKPPEAAPSAPDVKVIKKIQKPDKLRTDKRGRTDNDKLKEIDSIN